MKKLIVAGVVLGLLGLAGAGKVEGQTYDSQAYLQWMLAVTDDTLTPRMGAHLNAAGLYDKDQDRVAAVLQKFKAEEFGLEASYNNLPSVQAGRNDDTAEFYAKQDDLVQRTITKLRLVLFGDGFVRLDKRVQHEAKNIKVSATHRHSMLTPVSFGRPQRLGMTPNYTYYNTSASGFITSAVPASLLTYGGLSQWNATNLVDGDTSTVGFSTDASTPGCWLRVDFGSTPQDITEIGLYLSAANYNGQFSISYWNGSAWVAVSSNTFAPVEAGWNYAGWEDVGAHEFWLLALTNTPGAGPTINELRMVQSNLTLYTTSQVTGTTSCPDGCPPLAKHVGWAQVDIGTSVHDTFGPQVYPTGYINVSDNESTVLPVGGPPVNVGTTGGVNCTVAGNGFSGTPLINQDYEFAVTYSQNLGVSCFSADPSRPYCKEIIDYCLPTSVPPDYDPTQVISSNSIILGAPFFNGHTDCDRAHGAPVGTKWECLWPPPQGYVVPRGTPARRSCTNFDKGTKGDWPGPW